MNGYSEDLRPRIVSAVGRGMPKAQAARTFSVSLSSVKRYADWSSPLARTRLPQATLASPILSSSNSAGLL
jgi:hypothetical protein